MKGTPLTEQTYDYIVQLFAQDEKHLLEKMQRRAQEASIPMIMIGVEQAKFVGVFLKAMRAKRALDVGTLFGYSAAIMSRAMGPDSSVISLEFAERHAEVAKENLHELGLSNIDIRTGPALDHMKKLEDNSFDFIMIDADKPNYVEYLKESLRLIRPGGVIAGDNALAWGKIADLELLKSDPDYTSATAMQAFNKVFAAEKAMFSIIVPVGDGLAMGFVEK